MKLPGAEDETIPELIEMIEKTKEEQNKVIEINADGTVSKRQEIYATFLYDTDVEEEIYFLYVPENLKRRENFGSKEWLHNVIMKEYEANLIEVDEIEDGKVRNTMETYTSYGNPREEVHIIVKTTDDGRYKDQYKYKREGKDKDEKYIGGRNEEDSRFEYHDLGSFKEILNNDQQWDYNLKKTGGRFFNIDFMALTKESEREEVKAKLEGRYE